MRTQNFGRELVFSADLWYNEANEKPPSEREVARRSRDGRSLRDLEVLTSFVVTRSPSVTEGDSSLPEGAARRALLQGYGHCPKHL